VFSWSRILDLNKEKKELGMFLLLRGRSLIAISAKILPNFSGFTTF